MAVHSPPFGSLVLHQDDDDHGREAHEVRDDVELQALGQDGCDDTGRHAQHAPTAAVEEGHFVNHGRSLPHDGDDDDDAGPQQDEKGRRDPNSLFEAPSKWSLVCLFACSVIAYLLVWLVPTQSTRTLKLSIQRARAIVTATTKVASALVGLALGEIALQILDAAIWTAVLRGGQGEEPALALRELDWVAHRPGIGSGLFLMWLRVRRRRRLRHRRAYIDVGGEGEDVGWEGTTAPAVANDKRSALRRRHRHKLAWSATLAVSMLLLVLTATFGWLLDRTLVFKVEYDKRSMYDAISVAGDVTPQDVEAADTLMPFFEDFSRTWTAQSSATRQVPSSVKLPLPPQHKDYVFFAEVTIDHFSPSFVGYGAFSNESYTPSRSDQPVPSSALHPDDDDLGKDNEHRLSSDDSTSITVTGSDGRPIQTKLSYVRFPRWGLQTRCQRLTPLHKYLNPNIVLNTNDTANKNRVGVFLTRRVLVPLLAQLNISLPWDTTADPKQHPTYGELRNDIPDDIKEEHVMYAVPFDADGVAQEFFSSPVLTEDEIHPSEAIPEEDRHNVGSAGRGWASLDIVLVRLDPELAGPRAKFPLTANVPDKAGKFRKVGFDAALCAQRVRPYVVELYQGRGVQSTSIISQMPDLSREPIANRRSSLLAPNTTTHLSSGMKFAAYVVAAENSRNQLLKDNGHDSSWAPNPTVVSMSKGGAGGPAGYGELDAGLVADILSNADARLMLPYLVGNGKVAAHRYDLVQISRVKCSLRWLSLIFAIVDFCGVLGTFCVLRLPAGLPRRGTGPISWLVAFCGPRCLHIGEVPAHAVFARADGVGDEGGGNGDTNRDGDDGDANRDGDDGDANRDGDDGDANRDGDDRLIQRPGFPRLASFTMMTTTTTTSSSHASSHNVATDSSNASSKPLQGLDAPAGTRFGDGEDHEVQEEDQKQQQSEAHEHHFPRLLVSGVRRDVRWGGILRRGRARTHQLNPTSDDGGGGEVELLDVDKIRKRLGHQPVYCDDS